MFKPIKKLVFFTLLYTYHDYLSYNFYIVWPPSLELSNVRVDPTYKQDHQAL